MQLACKQESKKNLQQTITGDWIVLYPDEDLRNQKERKKYAAIQDSLTGLKCLKLIRFSEQGTFNQLDSIDIQGSWSTKDEEYVLVKGGGRGFDNFRTTFASYEKGVAKLIEVVNTEKEKIKIIWHLLKIEKGDATKLFLPEQNSWRKKAVKVETDEQLKSRLIQMLEFYSIYFKLLSEKSSYFIPGRVILPVKFYQHGIGMKFFDPESKFASLFYSKEQAKIAHIYLDVSLGKVKFNPPQNNSYTEEYSYMLQKLADELKKNEPAE